MAKSIEKEKRAECSHEASGIIKDMKAVILSGGSGVRLAPLTNTITKQLLPIANTPTLFHILELIKEETDIKSVCVVVSEDYGHQVKDELLSSKYNKHFDFDFVFQDKPLGLAHAVQITNMHIGDEPFLMFLGDILIAKEELKKAYEKFKKDNSETLVLLKEIDDPRPYGIAEVENGKVTKMVEKPQNPKSNLCLSGIYFFKPSIFYAIANIKPSYRGELEITDAVDYQIQNNKKVSYFVIENWWFDIGTPENMIKANEVMLANLPNKISSTISSTSKISGKAFIEENVSIEDSEITGPVIIAKNTKIKNCKIGPSVSIGSNVTLEDSKIDSSIIREGVKIKHAVLSNSIIGKNVEFAFNPESVNGIRTMYIVGDNTKCMSL